MAWKPPDPQPTIRQIYALAAVLCERAGEEWPGEPPTAPPS